MQQQRNPTTVSQMMAKIQELQNKVNSLSDAREFYDPESGSSSGTTHVPDQTSTVLSSRTLPLRFWIAAKYTELYGYYGRRLWTTTFSRRTILYNLPQFKGFCIFFSGIETWYHRYSKEKREWNEKRIVEYTDSITVLPKQKWHVFPYRWNLFSQWFGLLSKSFYCRIESWKNFLNLWNFKLED